MTFRRSTAVLLCGVVLCTACATRQAVKKAERAAALEDWDVAVGYYRDALARDPDDLGIRVPYERAMQMASLEHLRLARALESQGDLVSAVTEYRIAALVDPNSSVAPSRARELERLVLDRIGPLGPDQTPPSTAPDDTSTRGAASVSPEAIAGQPAGAAPAVAGPRLLLGAPQSQLPGGALQVGSGPHSVPIAISGVSAVTSLSLIITFDPAIVTGAAFSQGSFMSQGGAAVEFVPTVDAAAGRIQIWTTRSSGQPVRATSGVVGTMVFSAGRAGATDIHIESAATAGSSAPISLHVAPLRIVVR